MAAGEQAEQQLLDDVFLADDDLGELRVDTCPAGAQLFDGQTFGFIRINGNTHVASGKSEEFSSKMSKDEIRMTNQ